MEKGYDTYNVQKLKNEQLIIHIYQPRNVGSIRSDQQIYPCKQYLKNALQKATTL